MLFIENKYTRIYYSIINNAQSRILPKETYTEKHHIIPKSLGGSNAKDNLVVLTAREHFICHWLLTKMTESLAKTKMAKAFMLMQAQSNNQQRYTFNSRAYNTVRCMISEATKGTRTGKDNYNYGNRWTEEQRAKMRGHTRNVGLIRGPVANVENMRIAALNRWTEDEKAKKRDWWANNKYHFTCPHCGKTGTGKSNYNRWHGSNCRHIQSA